MFPVNIAPDISMYNLLISQGYDPAYALAEFIDNALQAHISKFGTSTSLAPLEISLHFYSLEFNDERLKNSISIVDNGPGITKQRLMDAMRPAKPPESKGLSEFGIGMKAAAVWFTGEWKLITKPSEENSKYTLDFNLSALISSHDNIINVQEVEDFSENGTKLVLNQLRRPISKHEFNSICNDLKELYQHFTSGESSRLILNAYYDDEMVPLKFSKTYHVMNQPTFKKVKGKVYSIGAPKEWKVDISFNFQGVNISGFICLWEIGSYPNNPGLVMFRHGRVIQGLSTKKFMPLAIYKSQNKHEAQRVYGELYADELPVTYTKNKFEINSETFGMELKSAPGVAELLKQASEYRLDNFICIDNESEIGKVAASEISATPAAPTTPVAPIVPTTPTMAPLSRAATSTTPSISDTPAPLTNILPLVPLDGGSSKRQLIKPEILQSLFQTDLYCEELIKQINWLFENKRSFKEIVIVALRNLLENHLDFTYGEAYPEGLCTKFDAKLNEMLNLIRASSKENLTAFVTQIDTLFNQTSRGYQTQSNLYNTYFSETSITQLLGALHLSAHKGSNIVNLDAFVEIFGKRYVILLELLFCIATYNKTIITQRLQAATP